MPKRYTDTELWSKPYFRTVPPKIKLLWKFLNDNCDLAGVWDGDFKLASFQIGEEVSEKDFEEYAELFNGRIERFKDHRWLLPTFIAFQYAMLSPASKPQMAVLRTLEKHGLTERFKAHIKGYDTLIEPLTKSGSTSKDKDKDRDKEKEKDKKIHFAEFVWMTREEGEKLVKFLQSKDRARECVQILNNYKAIPGNEDKYKSDYLAIRKWVVAELMAREKKGAVPYSTKPGQGFVTPNSPYDQQIECPGCHTKHNEKKCPNCQTPRPIVGVIAHG